jgi:hypothetical protein
MELDDAFSASLIDALIIFWCEIHSSFPISPSPFPPPHSHYFILDSKNRLRELTVLELLDNNEVAHFLDSIHEDQSEFIEDADLSAIWSAIIKGFEEYPILNLSQTNSSINEIIPFLSDSSKRAYGALICTCELIVEVSPRCAPVIVQSLYKVFISPILIGHSNSTSFIFSLLQDYKLYFPYFYTFCRRINRSPTTTLQQWREYFYPKHSTTTTTNIQDDEIQNLAQDWDMSGLEEGEDSDGEDQKSILGPSVSVMIKSPVIKRRTTRMSSTHHQRGVDQNNISADLLVHMQSPSGGGGGDRGEDNDGLLQIQDMSFDTSTPKSHRNQNSLSLHSGSDTKKSATSWENSNTRASPPKSEKKAHSAQTITIEDLRKAFSQSLDDDDSDLADKGYVILTFLPFSCLIFPSSSLSPFD